MANRPEDELRGALRRHLETDRLLGVDAAPLRVPSAPHPRAERPPQTASSRSTRSAARPATRKPDLALQKITDEELARRTEALRALDEQEVSVCRKCALHRTRTRTVFGQGHPAARLVFVGEAPGRDEDLKGVAFVGRAGQLLTKMIEAMGLTRDEVFICNILKCRPPNNRDPAPDEISACWPYLDQQLRIIQPEVIVALGKPAAQTLLRTKESIGRLRGQWHEYELFGMLEGGTSVPLMATYHPAYLLRNPNDKGKAWSDLKQVMARLGLPLPG